MCVPTPTKPKADAVDNGSHAAPWSEDNGDVIRNLHRKIFLGKFENFYIARAVKDKTKVGDALEEVADAVVSILRVHLCTETDAYVEKLNNMWLCLP